MSAALVLIDLNSQSSFELQYFPNEVRTEDGNNWQPQDTAGGKQPLFFANGKPRSTTFPELWLDNTDIGESLTDTLKDLRSFTLDIDESLGTPAIMLATWGDRTERVVLERLSVEETVFDSSGNPIRMRLSLDLLEYQPDNESTGVRDVT